MADEHVRVEEHPIGRPPLLSGNAFAYVRDEQVWSVPRLKVELGTGVFVICGQNSAAGGISDYWGVPLAMADDTRRILDDLRGA